MALHHSSLRYSDSPRAIPTPLQPPSIHRKPRIHDTWIHCAPQHFDSWRHNASRHPSSRHGSTRLDFGSGHAGSRRCLPLRNSTPCLSSAQQHSTSTQPSSPQAASHRTTPRRDPTTLGFISDLCSIATGHNSPIHHSSSDQGTPALYTTLLDFTPLRATTGRLRARRYSTSGLRMLSAPRNSSPRDTTRLRVTALRAPALLCSASEPSVMDRSTTRLHFRSLNSTPPLGSYPFRLMPMILASS